MDYSKITNFLLDVFGNKSLFGFSSIDEALAKKEGCKCALVTLLPYFDLDYNYNVVEYFEMLQELWKKHSKKWTMLNAFLMTAILSIKCPLPPLKMTEATLQASHTNELLYTQGLVSSAKMTCSFITDTHKKFAFRAC